MSEKGKKMPVKAAFRVKKSPRKHKPTEKYQEYLKSIYPKCNVDNMVVVMNEDINLAEEMDINDLIGKFTSMDINEGKTTGGGIGIPFPSYLIAIVKKFEEGGQALNAVYANIHTILEKGLELLQFLSNKNNCLRDYLKYLVGKNIIKLLEYYVIGAIAMSTNPIEAVQWFISILNMIGPTLIASLGGIALTIIGKYLSAIVTYYGKKIGEASEDAYIDIQNKIENFHKLTGKQAIQQLNDIYESLLKLINEHFPTHQQRTADNLKELMDEVKLNLTEKQRNLLEKVGELVDAKSVKEMHEEMERERKERAAAMEEDEIAGGKRHRKTKKHHKKSQKKYRKKSHKRHHKKK